VELFGVNILFILVGLGVAVGVTALLAAITLSLLTIIGGASVLLFWKTRKIVVPKLTLFILNLLENPIKNLIMLFNIDESFLDYMVIEIQNRINYPYYSAVPYTERAIFLPQCLRNPKCPAPLDAEGLQCKACGRCGVFKIKEDAERLGYKFFIAPGSTLIKRMVKKYRPKALLGIGCHMEVKEGAVALTSYGIPAQGVILERDGCVNTRIDMLKLLEKIHVDRQHRNPKADREIIELAREIGKMWDDTAPADVEIKKARSIYKR